MTNLILLGIVLVVVFCTWRSYSRSKDPLAPLLVFCPMLLYMYVYAPWAIEQNAGWDSFPRLRAHLEWAYLINLFSISAFCIAAGWGDRKTVPSNSFTVQALIISPRMRSALLKMALLLGAIGSGSFWYLVYVNGGPMRVFSHGKPFMASGSGYLGEAANLVFPALVLLALAWQGERIRLGRVLVVLCIASPHLTMGTVGGRRGPAFLVFMTLAVCYFLIRQRQPTVRTILGGLTVIGAFMFFLATQREYIYVGSAFDMDLTDTTKAITQKETKGGNETVCAVAGMVMINEHSRPYWGRRYATILFVRPIPRQFWPTKYADMGMQWMEQRPGSMGFTNVEWIRAVGFIPFRGNAVGLVADMFLEFSYFGIGVCYFLGALYRWVWNRSRQSGGLWTLLYLMMLSFSVYLPSQSVQAWLVRLLVLAAPTIFLWRMFVGKRFGWKMPARAIQPAPRSTYAR